VVTTSDSPLLKLDAEHADQASRVLGWPRLVVGGHGQRVWSRAKLRGDLGLDCVRVPLAPANPLAVDEERETIVGSHQHGCLGDAPAGREADHAAEKARFGWGASCRVAFGKPNPAEPP
jgi:hypothetical protein